MANALQVDLKGLRQLVERRGKSFVILELIQNCWDEDGVTHVSASIERIDSQVVLLRIEDDAPEGFHNLRDAYTLFAPSRKKQNAEKRGRFNLGEKLVIAIARRFRVRTTTGGMEIDVIKDERRTLRTKRARGSEIEVELRMTNAEYQDLLKVFRTLIPPPGIRTELNNDVLPYRNALTAFKAQLRTEVADHEGFLRPTTRLTQVEVYEPVQDEVGTLYEMGIPVVETGDRYHVNVMQKVPLNTDRDNVTPAFLRDVRAEVLNAVVAHLTSEDTSATWVNTALESPRVEHKTVVSVLDRRFGVDRVVYDPSDHEANRIAGSTGYTVVPGRVFSGPAWDNIRAANALLPAGQVTPSPKPFHPDGSPLELITPRNAVEERFVDVVDRLHQRVLGEDIAVLLTDDTGWGFRATYGGHRLIFNLALVMPQLFNEETFATVAHEFGHFYGDHLTHEFDSGIAKVAAKIAWLAINEPKFLETLR